MTRSAHTCAALVEEICTTLREEVKEMEKTNWLYEANDPLVSTRIKL